MKRRIDLRDLVLDGVNMIVEEQLEWSQDRIEIFEEYVNLIKPSGFRKDCTKTLSKTSHQKGASTHTGLWPTAYIKNNVHILACVRASWSG